MTRLDALSVTADDHRGAARLRITELRNLLDVIDHDILLGKSNFPNRALTAKASAVTEALTLYTAAFHAQQVEEVRLWQRTA